MGYDENRSKPGVRNTSEVSLNVSLGAIDLGLGVFFIYLLLIISQISKKKSKTPKCLKEQNCPWQDNEHRMFHTNY